MQHRIMEDDAFIKQKIKDLEDSVHYFSSGLKSERELSVAKSFVENLNISHNVSEFTSPNQDPPDVIFREAQFEIKEILDPGRSRHEEYKKELKFARTLTNTEELLEQFIPIDKTISEIYQLILTKAQSITKYPESVKKDLDLLFYVNLQDAMGLIEIPFPDTMELNSLGWRSVSFIMGHRSCVLCINVSTPAFLVKAAHHIHHWINND